jgi:hypothetical protein
MFECLLTVPILWCSFLRLQKVFAQNFHNLGHRRYISDDLHIHNLNRFKINTLKYDSMIQNSRMVNVNFIAIRSNKQMKNNLETFFGLLLF